MEQIAQRAAARNPYVRHAAFAHWQPEFEAHGIPTFPVDGAAKRPLVRGYLKVGSAYSRKLTSRFPDAQAYGFALRNRVTVLDIDSSDERVLADALDRHGPSPLIIRSGGGNFQAWYKSNGEGRHVRPDPTRPIDVLGGGFVIGPGSAGTRGRYEIIQGHLDDIGQLPPLRNFSLPPSAGGGGLIGEGRRNSALWKHCMRNARSCDDFDALLDVAKTYNADQISTPLSDHEIFKTAKSAWQVTERGENRFGQKGAWSPAEEVNRLVASDPDLFLLLSFLRANNGPRSQFWIANGLCETLGWTRKRLSAARSRLANAGYVSQVRPQTARSPAIFRWPGGRRERGEVLVEDQWSILTTLNSLPPEPVSHAGGLQ
jgi:hypothetical protein